MARQPEFLVVDHTARVGYRLRPKPWNGNVKESANAGAKDNCWLYTVEINDYQQQLAQEMFDFSGLNNVTILKGESTKIIPNLGAIAMKRDVTFKYFDFVFIDHHCE